MTTRKTQNPRKNRAESGSAFIELAIMSLIMLPLFFGVLDFSRVFYYASVAQGAARAGTQFAIIDPPNHANTTGMQNAALADATNVASPNTLTATASSYCMCYGSTAHVSCSTSCSSNGELMQYAEVDTVLTFAMYFHYPMLPSSLTVNGKSIIRVQ